MITTELKICFKLHRLLFIYLPEYLVVWDEDYENIAMNHTPLTWGVWATFMSDAVCIAIGNFYVVYTNYFVEKRPHFHLTHAFIFVAGGIAVSVCCIIAGMLQLRSKDLISGFNSMNALDKRLTKKYRPKAFDKDGKFTNEGKSDLIGFGACIMTCCLATSPYWIISFVAFQHFDCTSFILDDILPDAKYRDLRTIMLVTLARMALFGPSIVSVVWGLSFLLPLGLAFMNAGFSCVKYLVHKVGSLAEFIYFYSLFSLAYKFIEFVIGDMLYVILSVDFFGTVGAIGFCIVAWDRIDTMMYFCLSGGTVLAIVATGLSFVKMKAGLIMIEDMVEERVVRAKLKYAMFRTRKARMVRSWLVSFRVIRIPYGPFFCLQKEFGLEYFSNLVENVVDNVLMFDLR